MLSVLAEIKIKALLPINANATLISFVLFLFLTTPALPRGIVSTKGVNYMHDNITSK